MNNILDNGKTDKTEKTVIYHLCFSGIPISKASVFTVSPFSGGELPLSLRIKDLLRHGAMPVKEIAEVLEANEATTRTAINRMSKKGYLVKVGESWGLKQ